VQQIKHEQSRFRGNKDTITINWGSGNPLPEECYKGKIINHPALVAAAINKRTFLHAARRAGVHTVPWTERQLEADAWIRDGHTVYCRTRLEGKEGEGITVAKTYQQMIPARLYTKEVKADREYRVHAVDEQAIAVHRKVSEKRDAVPSIRNTANGWVFKRVTIYDKDIVDQALKAVKSVGLDFGAVDVLFDGKQAWVMEVNTAPGIDEMEWTVGQYAKSLRVLAEKIHKK
jgi:hypothetical protein